MATWLPKREAPSATTAPPPTKSYLNDPDIVSLREALDDGQSVTDEETATLRKLYVNLREFETQKRAEEDYTAAKKARDQAEAVLAEIQSREPKARAFSGPVATTDAKASYRNKWRESAAEFDKVTAEKRNNIIARQQQRMDRFNEHWGKDMPRKYRKPSFRLIQLKKMEHSFAASGDYDQASKYHREAEQLAREETNRAQKRLVQDYKVAQNNIYQRQANELQHFDSSRADAKRVMQSKLMNEMRAAMNRDNVLKQRRVSGDLGSDGQRRSQTWKKVTIPVPVKAEVERSKGFQKTLLPPLKPPNDPALEVEEYRNRREKARQAKAFERRKAQEKAARAEMLRRFEEERKALRRRQGQTSENFVVEPFMTISPAVVYKRKVDEETEPEQVSSHYHSESNKEEFDKQEEQHSSISSNQEDAHKQEEHHSSSSSHKEDIDKHEEHESSSSSHKEDVGKNEEHHSSSSSRSKQSSSSRGNKTKMSSEHGQPHSEPDPVKEEENENSSKKPTHSNPVPTDKSTTIEPAPVSRPRQPVKTLYIGGDNEPQEFEDSDSDVNTFQESEPEPELQQCSEPADESEQSDSDAGGNQNFPEVKTIYLMSGQ